MAHTPGPWRAHRPGEWDDPSEYWEIDDGYGHTATVYGDTTEAEANARLMAAAPELLNRLRMAAEFISGHNGCLSVPSGSDDRQWNDYCIGLLEDCQLAIAKAEGRVA